jgi:hypothetical protein
MEYETLILVFNISTALWLLLWAVRSALRLMKGARSTALIAIIIHFFYCGLPLILDLIFGAPDYLERPGFHYATNDDTTSMFYSIYVSAVPLLWWYLGVNKNFSSLSMNSQLESNKQIKWLFVVIIAALPISWLLAPNPSVYSSYGAVAQYMLSYDEFEYHKIVALLSILTVVSVIGLLNYTRNIKIHHYVIAFPWLFLAIWLNGKRHLVIFVVMLIFYTMINKKIVTGKGIIAIGGVLAICFYGYSVMYQSKIRGIDASFVEDNKAYDFMRIDYGRDAVIKFTIYAELYPERIQILEYRGQSILFHVTTYIPRDFWPDKPLPYAQYVTSAVLMRPPQLLGWSTTTSILEESIANLSWYGMLVGPLWILLICRIGDACKTEAVSNVTALIAILFLSVHLTAFSTLFLLWVFLVIYSWHTMRRPRSISRMQSSLANAN